MEILKKVIIVIVIIIAALIIKDRVSGYLPILKDDYYTGFESSAELEKYYSGRGEYEVSCTEFACKDSPAGAYRVWYPEEKSGKLPLIIVVNGSNTPARKYKPFFERLATWGFVVAGNDDPQTGSGKTTSEMLDYLLFSLGDAPFAIDEENIGYIGYSQGGAGALKAVCDYENGRYCKALFTGSAAYSYLAGNMGWGYDMTKISVPYFMTAGTGSSDDRGIEDIISEFGGVAPLKSLEENYDAMPEDVFKLRGRVSGAEHEEMLVRTDGYMTAWMLYNLKDDEKAGEVFLGENAEILKNSNWQDVEKNR